VIAPQRIAVIGCCGAGKSQLSMQLGAKLQLPVIHLDQLAWAANWVEVPRDELVRRQEQAFKRDGRWIADGNYGGTMAMRLAVADTIVFMDFPTPLCVYRVLKRRVQYFGRTRPDMTPGCPERFLDREFPKFLHYVATFRARHRPRILAKLATLDGSQRLITLRSPREVSEFVASLG
jgi:adenylate kinase family enzyme